jgi:hypothetical protein
MDEHLSVGRSLDMLIKLVSSLICAHPTRNSNDGRVIACVFFPPLGHKVPLVAGWIVFSLIMFVPVLDIFFARKGTQALSTPGTMVEPIQVLAALVYLVQIPFTVVAIVVAYRLQAILTEEKGEPGALSSNTLLLQTILFGVLGLSWVGSLFLRGSEERIGNLAWYFSTGWAAVVVLLLALEQGCLYRICRRLGDLGVSPEEGPQDDIDDEHQPLIV